MTQQLRIITYLEQAQPIKHNQCKRTLAVTRQMSSTTPLMSKIKTRLGLTPVRYKMSALDLHAATTELIEPTVSFKFNFVNLFIVDNFR